MTLSVFLFRKLRLALRRVTVILGFRIGMRIVLPDFFGFDRPLLRKFITLAAKLFGGFFAHQVGALGTGALDNVP